LCPNKAGTLIQQKTSPFTPSGTSNHRFIPIIFIQGPEPASFIDVTWLSFTTPAHFLLKLVDKDKGDSSLIERQVKAKNNQTVLKYPTVHIYLSITLVDDPALQLSLLLPWFD
jgi:hypothetical protein